jgi:hypothetical protein
MALLLTVLILPAGAGAQETAGGLLQREEAARMLLAEGVEGLRRAFSDSNSPALTFDQETQIRSAHDGHARVLDELVDNNGGSRDGLEAEITELEDQLLLAALKFLNPVQRTALAGSLAAEDFAALNSDLPEDPDELREYLNDLRSPTGDTGGGFNGGGFNGGGGGGGGGGRGGGGFSGGGNNNNNNNNGGLSVNGFGGGARMPSRDEILEIRINENAFTAEQSNQGRGQTQIITRGGTGRLNGDATFNFADEALDARNALANSRPFYQRRDFSANVSGPVIRNRLTMTFGIDRNEQEQASNIFATTPNGTVNDAISQPGQSREYRLGGTAQLAQNHVLNVNYRSGNQSNDLNNVGNFNLVEQGSAQERTNWNLQVRETAVLSRSINHEATFSITAFQNVQNPLNPGVNINVVGAFRGGGGTNDTRFEVENYNFGNLLMYTGNAISLRMGYAGGLRRNYSISRSNFNGTYTFSSLYDYCGAIGFPGSQCQVERADKEAEKAAFEAANPGETLDIMPRPASRYAVSRGNPELEINQLSSAVFFQSDWRARPDLTLSFGARYEWQEFLDDYNNIDPRFGFAYQLGTNTVLRGGSGIFHQQFDFNLLNNLLRLDGTRQESIIITNPSFPDPFADGDLDDTPSEIRVRSEDLVAPYTWHSEVSIETSLNNGFTLTGAYGFVRSIHLYRSRNLNPPLPGCTATLPSNPTDAQISACRADPTRGNNNQLESTGAGSDHRLRLGFRHRLSFMNLNGSYTFSSNYDDVPGGDSFELPADNFDLDAEWGRSGARHRYNTSANFRLPWNVNADTIFNWSSGDPYTLTTGEDDNLDTEVNDRPEGLPRNSETGPGFFEVDMRLSKAIQLRSEEVFVEGGGTGPAASDGYYGQRTGLRMTIRADISNLLNTTNFQSYGSVLSNETLLGQPTRARDARRVSVSVRFDF